MKNLKFNRRISKTLAILFLFVICSNNLIFAETGDSLNVKPESSKSLFFMGIGIGARTIQRTEQDIYLNNEKIDLGGTTPVTVSLVVQYQAKCHIMGQFAIDGFISKTSGAVFSLAGGYRLGSEKFAFVPLFGIGYSNAKTKLEEIPLHSGTYLYGDLVYVGPNASNYGRGTGADITLNIQTNYWNLKPAVQIQGQFSRVTLFGEIGYNIATGPKYKISLDGKGYKSLEDYYNASTAPVDLQRKGKLEDIITDADSKPVSVSPVKFSGVNFQIGIAANLTKANFHSRSTNNIYYTQ